MRDVRYRRSERKQNDASADGRAPMDVDVTTDGVGGKQSVSTDAPSLSCMKYTYRSHLRTIFQTFSPCMYGCMYVCICVRTLLYVYLWMYVCLYFSACVCVCVFVDVSNKIPPQMCS